MPWLSNANTMTANWPILILFIDGTNNIRCFHNLTTCKFRRQGFTLSCRSIFSCEDTALQGLMSVCVSVVNWYFQLYTTSRMFQNAPECMQNVPVCSRITVECSRMHAECSRMFQNACRMFQNACSMFQNACRSMSLQAVT